MVKAYVKHDYRITGKDFVDIEDSDLPIGNVDYSLEEQDTGVKWIDGSTIYQKTFETGGLPNASTKNVDHEIANLNYVLDMRGFAKNPLSGVILPLPYLTTTPNGSLGLDVTSTQLQLFTSANLSAYTESWVTLWYTKSEGE